MKQQKVEFWLVQIFTYMLIIILGTGCERNLNNMPGAQAGISDNSAQLTSPQSVTRTPTVINEAGSAELVVSRDFTAKSGDKGQLIHKVNANVPLKINTNKDTKVWEVKGNKIGVGTTRYEEENKCFCQADWDVEVTVSGTLVPLGGLISEGPEGGCYMQLHVNENWRKVSTLCTCDIGSGVVTEGVDPQYFGPLKFLLINGFPVVDANELHNTYWDYEWKVEKLDIPVSTGCGGGEVIK